MRDYNFKYNDDLFAAPKFKEIKLDRQKIGMRVVLNKDYPYFDEYIDAQITAYIWAQDAGKRVDIKYPANWWEAFKERWLPFLGVRYIDKSFIVKATYPDLNIQTHEPVLKLYEVNNENAV